MSIVNYVENKCILQSGVIGRNFYIEYFFLKTHILIPTEPLSSLRKKPLLFTFPQPNVHRFVHKQN